MRVEEKRLLAFCLFLSLLLASGLIAIRVLKEEPRDLLPSTLEPRLLPENEMPEYFMKVGKSPEWKDLIILTKLGKELDGPDVPYGGTLVVGHGVGADGYYWVWFYKDKMTEVNQDVITTIVEEVNRVAREIGFTGELPIKFAIASGIGLDACRVVLSPCISSKFRLSNNVENNVIADKEDAQNFINANEILTHFESISTQVGIGTVTEVTSRMEVVGDKGRWTIITYAKILVRIPLSDNIESGQIIGTKYSGGEAGDRRLIVNIDWCYGPNDTAIVPSVFKLEKGLDIIFFIDDNTSELRGYVPSTLND